MLSQRILLRTARNLASKPAIPRSGKRLYSSPSAEENAFIREREAVRKHAAESADLWRKLSIYVVVPSVIIAAANAYTLWNEHWEHVAHETPLEEKPQYEYLNIRSKNYPWGDGDKTLFWNDKHNFHKKD